MNAEEEDCAAVAKVLADLENFHLVREFLFALLTPRERARIAGRWQLVCFLALGMPQREIARRLGMSLCKITRGSRELRHGSPAFRKIVRRFARTHERTRS